MQRHFEEIAAELLLAPGDTARLVAAEVLFLGGAGNEARRVLGEVATRGETGDGRARALYLLGEHFFLRERFVRDPSAEGRKGNALQYWKVLAEHHGETEWARRAARPLRYLRLLETPGLPVPAFRETFRAGGEEIEVSSESLRGKLVVLDFWSSQDVDSREFQTRLARDMKAVLDQYPELAGRVEILGIHLDPGDRAPGPDTPWPWHHDGLGLKTPLADLLGIPRAPHRLVMDPEGRVAYLGAGTAPCFEAITRELRRLREAK